MLAWGLIVARRGCFPRREHEFVVTTYLVSQIIEAASLALSIYGSGLKNDIAHRVAMLVCAILSAIHWGLLGSWAPALICFLIGVRTIHGIFGNGNAATIVYCSMFCVATLVYWHCWMDIIPLFMSLVATVVYMKLDGVKLRMCLIGTNVGWVYYSFAIGSWAAVVGAVLSAFMLWRAIIRIGELE